MIRPAPLLLAAVLGSGAAAQAPVYEFAHRAPVDDGPPPPPAWITPAGADPSPGPAPLPGWVGLPDPGVSERLRARLAPPLPEPAGVHGLHDRSSPPSSTLLLLPDWTGGLDLRRGPAVPSERPAGPLLPASPSGVRALVLRYDTSVSHLLTLLALCPGPGDPLPVQDGDGLLVDEPPPPCPLGRDRARIARWFPHLPVASGLR